MEYRYHPLLEGLKVNEDGSEILQNGTSMLIRSVKLPHTRNKTLQVSFGKKTVNVIRLVCETWHGISPAGDYAARRVDEEKGDHYSNLYWGKKGMTISSAKGVIQPTAKMSIEVYNEVLELNREGKSIKAILKEKDISENRFYQFQKKHVKSKK